MAEADEYEELEPKEEVAGKSGIFIELWDWMEKRINRLYVLKGWTRLNRKDGELIVDIYSDLTKLLETLKRGNPSSKEIERSRGEELVAMIMIRLMDISYSRSWHIPTAIEQKLDHLKSMEYRSPRP